MYQGINGTLHLQEDTSRGPPTILHVPAASTSSQCCSMLRLRMPHYTSQCNEAADTMQLYESTNLEKDAFLLQCCHESNKCHDVKEHCLPMPRQNTGGRGLNDSQVTLEAQIMSQERHL